MADTKRTMKSKSKAKVPSTFAWWSTSMQAQWLEQHGYPEIADDLRSCANLTDRVARVNTVCANE